MTSDIGGHRGALQQRTPRKSSFTAQKRQRFLDALSLTCNVQKSAAHAKVCCPTLYDHRGRDPVFAAQWRAALATGYDRLEALVLEYGGAGMPLEPADPDRADAQGADPQPFDFDRAMQVLKLYRQQRNGQSDGMKGRRPVFASPAETNAAIIKALAAAKRRIERSGKRDA